MFISQVHTHIHSLFKTHDNTNATADGVTSSSSARNTHIHSLQYTLSNTLMIIQKIKQIPRQMEMHHVHQSGTHTHTHTLSLSLSLPNTLDKTDAIVDGDASFSSYTLSSIIFESLSP